jgi:drug/metabolite transporter (DMT)-like permease
MFNTKTIALVAFAMLAFAGNSLLCRLALKGGGGVIDAASFTTLRLVSGAITLSGLAWWQQRQSTATPHAGLAGDGWSGLALFVYAAGFSFAYLSMTAATGALLLFGAVQATMIGWGVWRGERLRKVQVGGLAVAAGGLLVLMLPGVATPNWWGCTAMLASGVAWGTYSLRGRRKKAGNSAGPIAVTAGNFLRAVPMTIILSAVTLTQLHLTPTGTVLALVSGALTSGVGYAIWYRVLPALPATHAATVQLSVPMLAALGGVAVLGESATWTMALSGLAILGGIGLVLQGKKTLGK